MADEEQFSLCWNNFNSNLSAGFHESLCKGDLVDVTLAAEGQLVKAHRLVLSVCSPYFRKMFTQMPSNQHAFVFLKDVSHAALKDLIQFMYCGEVNVKQDALPTFISTAEALQIKGLTETGEPTTPTQTPTPASQSPLKAPTPIPTSHNIMTSSSPRSRIHHQQQQQQQQQHQQQRNQNRGSYKAESESETDDKVITSTPAGSSSTIQMVSQKRVLQRSLTPQTSSGGGSAATVAKRPKIITTTSTSSGDPLESGGETIIAQPQTTSSTTTTHIITTISDPKNVSDEPEFIELPIETIPTTKSEPDYGDEEESGEVETVDQDATYVEDDSYGDMKYDESYFTENDDAKPGASGGTGGGGGGGFSDTYTDQSVTEAQDEFFDESERVTDGELIEENFNFQPYCTESTPQQSIDNSENLSDDKEDEQQNKSILKTPVMVDTHQQTVVRTIKIFENITPSSPVTKPLKFTFKDILPENIVKVLDNGHALVNLRRTRVQGFCVECIKKKSDPDYKKNLKKIITYCPKCPDGSWVCEPCFDEIHQHIFLDNEEI